MVNFQNIGDGNVKKDLLHSFFYLIQEFFSYYQISQ